jgi:murein DD-endopeptidase MepM/ murein hydrolase activator NlpD
VLSLPAAAAAFPLEPTPPPPPPAVAHPVSAAVGYGEHAARFGGPRPGRVHEGQDMFAAAGTPLVAVRDAVVLETGGGDARGHYATLFSREAGETYVYLHLLHPASVRAGERVAAGQGIGRLGCTGSCWGDHLHFEIRRGRGATGRALDPLPRLRRWSRAG